jgi:hypothetical protein
MSNLEVRAIKDSEFDLWNLFAASSPQGTIFHKSYWLIASGEEFCIYGYFKGDELFAGLPLCFNTSRLGIKKAYHPYLTPYLGIVFRDSKAKYVTRVSDEKDMARAIAQKVKEDFDSINFDFTTTVIDSQPFIWEGFTARVKYTYILQVDDLDNVWNNMDAKRRNDITKAEKDGIYVEVSDDFEQTFALVEKTFERQKKDVDFRSAAFRYNETLNRKGQCRSFLAKSKENQAIGVVYIVCDEKRSYYLLGGYDPQKSHHGASAIAMWEAIKFTKNELGLNQFDFEGSMIQPVEMFFRKFGGELTPYYSVSWMKPHIKAFSYARKLLEECLRKSPGAIL